MAAHSLKETGSYWLTGDTTFQKIMKKNFFNFMMIALMGLVCVTTFTACGDDNDEDVIGGETSDVTIGTHRIDVSFDGNFSGWSVEVGFVGSPYGTPLYEDGEELKTEVGTWTGKTFRSYSVSTNDKSQNLAAVITLKKNGKLTVQPVTVNLRSYINGKQNNMKSVVVDGSHNLKNITLYTIGSYNELDLD